MPFCPRVFFGRAFSHIRSLPKTGHQPTRFVIVAGKLRYSVPARKLPDGRVYLRFDLSLLPDGEHTVNVRAIDDRAQGESNQAGEVVKTGQKVTLLALPEKVEPTAPPEEQQKTKMIHRQESLRACSNPGNDSGIPRPARGGYAVLGSFGQPSLKEISGGARRRP